MDPAIPESVEAYLQKITIPVRIAAATQSGWPMVVSLWYLYEAGHILCATQRTARIVEYLSHEPRCAFEVSSENMPYCGVRGQALAEIVAERGGEVLERLLERYLGGRDNSLARNLMSRQEAEVAIVLSPVNLFSWNFTTRMRDALPHGSERPQPCPPRGVRLDLT